jgi:D-tagatose-1,6-bisphosphate aldolase subunit GatZ/KbaZ
VEFGDDFVLPYNPQAAQELSRFIESETMIYEAHSTDYQARTALQNLVRGHFAILKVGPALTFAFREAVFALAMMENELFAEDRRSNIIQVLDNVMVKHPEHWEKYYRGDETAQAYKRKYSLSDRARYYWVQPEVQDAFERLAGNFKDRQIPLALMSQFAPMETDALCGRREPFSFDNIISRWIARVLDDYG